jgi:hypothetical protein
MRIVVRKYLAMTGLLSMKATRHGAGTMVTDVGGRRKGVGAGARLLADFGEAAGVLLESAHGGLVAEEFEGVVVNSRFEPFDFAQDRLVGEGRRCGAGVVRRWARGRSWRAPRRALRLLQSRRSG